MISDRNKLIPNTASNYPAATLLKTSVLHKDIAILIIFLNIYVSCHRDPKKKKYVSNIIQNVLFLFMLSVQ